MNYLAMLDIYSVRNMKIIGISGLARSGKDSFYEMSKPYFDKYNIKSKRYAFAECLKQECDPFLRQNINISAFTEVDEEKKLIRPFLVSYGTHIRRKINKNCWIEKIEEKVKSDLSLNTVVFITDVRFPNEVEWVHKTGGESIHIKREGILPPNEDEKLNDPILSKLSKYKLTWGDFKENYIDEYRSKVNGILKSIIETQ